MVENIISVVLYYVTVTLKGLQWDWDSTACKHS